MRLSADPSHPDFCRALLHAHVYLDGEPMARCLRADEEAGTVVCVVVDGRGALVLDGDDVQEVTLSGWVDIIPLGEHFDTWMTRRVERAHRAYMARTAALPR